MIGLVIVIALIICLMVQNNMLENQNERLKRKIMFLRMQIACYEMKDVLNKTMLDVKDVFDNASIKIEKDIK